MIDAATENVITIAEAARRLGKTDDTVRAYIRRGLLDGCLLAGRLHTSLEALRRAAPPYEPEKKEERRAKPRWREELEAAGIL